jgi:hypothetical protein
MISRKIFYPCLSFLFAAAIFSGCKKARYEDALPVTEITSVTMIDDETAEVKGKLVSPGEAGIEYLGFCYGYTPNPDMESNETLVQPGEDGTFTGKVKLQQDSTYYFRAFATNYFGYSMSRDFEYTVPHAGPQIAPCPLDDNTILLMSTKYPVGGTGFSHPLYGTHGVYADSEWGTGGPGIEIEFKKYPANGVYTTVDDGWDFRDYGKTSEVYVSVSDETVEPGGKVYVSENPDGSLLISFCDLKFYFSSSEINTSAKFVVK